MLHARKENKYGIYYRISNRAGAANALLVVNSSGSGLLRIGSPEHEQRHWALYDQSAFLNSIYLTSQSQPPAATLPKSVGVISNVPQVHPLAP